ncbi:ATP/GTP-binding protein [Kangiella sp. TOML190]|uniref:AAA family ATPase n=1 Tax=Kangiella sp. TOML190 TaxID=2931351 RepID=UPI002041DDA4|nr:ATP-binding protein [Kangiella sp. TOML190]
MIKKYTFENFQSYLEECHVDFTVNKKSAHSYYDYELEDGSKIAKVMAVLGANGSGKSNLLKPLSFLSWFIPNSFGSLERNEGIPILPYLLNQECSTKIELEFLVPRFSDGSEEVEYKYFIELNERMVLNESLKVKTSKLYSNVISRTYNENIGKYDVKNSADYGVDLKRTVLEKAPENCSIISYILTLLSEDDLLTDKTNSCTALAAKYFQANSTNIRAIGRSPFHETMDDATDFYLEHPDFFEKIKSLLMKYDLGISDIKLEQKILLDSRTGKETEKVIPIFLHEVDGGSFEIPIFLESSGTQSAYCILAIITETLASGGVAILDEFDNDLHPLLTMEIIELFKDDSININNSQLLFNTHTVEVLKMLRKQHCYLVEKKDGKSEAYRADEVEGLLARDNLYAKYISGALGAVPEFD